MRKLINLCVLAAISGSIICQEVNTEEILKKFTDKIKNYETIYTKFSFQNISTENENTDSFEGEMILKDDKYKLIFPGNEIVSNSTTTWQYIKDLNEVTISEKEDDDESSILGNPKSIFTVYVDEFKYKFNKEIKLNNKICYEIDLFPLKLDESAYSRIRLHINKQNLHLYDVKYVGKDGNDFVIEIKEFTGNDSYDDAFFNFDVTKYPEIEINDMR